MPRQPSPETQLRTLKSELKRWQKESNIYRDKLYAAEARHKREVEVLTMQIEHLKKDNQRLEEIASLARETAELLRQQLATERQIA